MLEYDKNQQKRASLRKSHEKFIETVKSGREMNKNEENKNNTVYKKKLLKKKIPIVIHKVDYNKMIEYYKNKV
jgi:hypothetical protein